MRIRLTQLPNLGALLRSHFFAGLLVVIPLGVIAWIVAAALRALWGLNQILPSSLQPENFLHDPTAAFLLRALITLGAALLVALGVSVVGWASRQIIGQKFLELLASEVIQRIPFVRSIYSALDQLLKALAAGGGQQFNRVVYIEWPRKGIWAIAFVTSPARAPALPPGHLNVFVPATPNPTSGFHMIVPESEVRDAQMKVEDAFKTILSLGIAQGKAHVG